MNSIQLVLIHIFGIAVAVITSVHCKIAHFSLDSCNFCFRHNILIKFSESQAINIANLSNLNYFVHKISKFS